MKSFGIASGFSLLLFVSTLLLNSPVHADTLSHPSRSSIHADEPKPAPTVTSTDDEEGGDEVEGEESDASEE